MRVLLIFPPATEKFDPATLTPYPPLGLLYLASSLRQAKIDVQILDCVVEKLNFSSALLRIKEFNPDIVGISVLTSMRYSAFELAKQIKHSMPNVTIVVGGSHATALHQRILEKIPQIDIVVRGEGEIILRDLVLTGDRNKVKGISYRDEKGRIVINEDRQEVQDLDSLGLPAYDLVPMNRYFKFASTFRITKRFPSAHILTSRGCVAKCIFCTTSKFWKKIRLHSPEYVIENMKHLINNYGVNDLMIFDDTFPISLQWLEKFYCLYKENNLDLSYRCFSRVTMITQRSITLLKKTGCYYILFGIESGSPKILSSLKKYINVGQIKHAVALTRSEGVSLGGFFMVGFPNETSDDVALTINLAKQLKLSEFHFASTQLLPDSELTQRSGLDENIWFQIPETQNLTGFSFSPAFKSDLFTERQIEALTNYANYQVLKNCFFRRMVFKIRNQRINKIKSVIYSIRDLLATAGQVRYEENKDLLKNFQWNIFDNILATLYNNIKNFKR